MPINCNNMKLYSYTRHNDFLVKVTMALSTTVKRYYILERFTIG